MAWEQRPQPKSCRVGKSAATSWGVLVCCRVSIQVVLLFLLPAVAFAERVVIVRPDGDPALTEVFNRVRGELRMRGFETVLVSEEGPTTQAELRRVASFGQADAAVAFEHIEGEPTCHIWLADRDSDRDLLMSIAVPETEEAPTLLALRTVELLRSSLRERAPPGPPPRIASRVGVVRTDRSSARAPTSIPNKTRSPGAPLRYSFRLGGESLWLVSRQPPSLALTPAIGYALTADLTLAATAILVTNASEVETARARGAVRADFLLIDLRWSLARPHRVVRLELSAAAGVARCTAEGGARSGSTIQGRTASTWPTALRLGAAGWFPLTPRWQFGISGAIGAMLPKPVLRVEQSDTELGRPWVELGAGFEYAI